MKLLWSLYAYTYDGLLKFWPYSNLISETEKALELSGSGKLLDAGCGTGNLLRTLMDKHSGFTAEGVDISGQMIKAAGRKLAPEINQGRVKLHSSDLLSFLRSAPENSYDAVVTVNVLYALPERLEVIRQLVRVAKPGSRIVINTSTRTGSSAIIREHIAHAGWLSLLRFKLAGVFLVDALINLLGNAGKFPFPSEEEITEDLKNSGAEVKGSSRCYGGVNALIVAVRK